MAGTITEIFGFQGRLTRRAYWRWYLGLALIGAALWVTMIFAAMSNIPVVPYSLLGLFLLALYAAVGTAIRRLHDRGKSGWWLLLYQGAPLAAGSLSWWTESRGFHSMAVDGATMVAAIAGLIVSVWGLIEIGFLRGQATDNRFGPVSS